MPTDAADVYSQGKAGSDRRAVKVAQLMQDRRRQFDEPSCNARPADSDRAGRQHHGAVPWPAGDELRGDESETRHGGRIDR